MAQDILFILSPSFDGDGREEYCPECAEMFGLLCCFPDLKDHLDIRYLEIAKPREQLVSLLGADHQNCPTLVLSGGYQLSDGAPVKSANGVQFFDNARDIGHYLAERYGRPYPRGHRWPNAS